MPYIYRIISDADDNSMATETLRDLETRHMRLKVKTRTLVAKKQAAAIGDKPAIQDEIAALRVAMDAIEVDALAVVAANPTVWP